MKIGVLLGGLVDTLGSGWFRTVEWLKSIPNTTLRSSHLFYLNRVSPRLWIFIGIVAYAVIRIQVMYPNTSAIPNIGLRLALSTGQSMMSAFVFFIVVHNYTIHSKKDKEHRQIAEDLYYAHMTALEFFQITDKQLRSHESKDFQRILYELECNNDKGDLDGLDVLRQKAQRELLYCLMGLNRVARYSFEHTFDAQLSDVMYHLRIIVDPAPVYSRDSFRHTVCEFYKAFSSLRKSYGHDFSTSGHVVLKQRRDSNKNMY